MNWKETNEFRWLLIKPPFDGGHPSAFFAYEGSRVAQVLQQKWVREFIYKDENKERDTPHEDWRDVPIVTEESK